MKKALLGAPFSLPPNSEVSVARWSGLFARGFFPYASVRAFVVGELLRKPWQTLIDKPVEIIVALALQCAGNERAFKCSRDAQFLQYSRWAALRQIALQLFVAREMPQRKLGLPLPMLTGRSARVVITSDTPGWFMRLVYKNALIWQVRRQILEFVGFKPTKLTHLGPASEAKPEQVQRWVKQIRDLGAQAA
jgi:hypothetical protein